LAEIARSTFQIGQDRKSCKMPLVEQPLPTRLESKSKIQATSPVEEEIVVKNLDDGTENKLTIMPLASQPQLTRLEPRPKPIPADEQPVLRRANAPKIEHSRRKSILIGAPPPVRPSLPKIQTVSKMKESLKSPRNGENIPKTRPSLPKTQIPSTMKEILRSQRYQESPPAAKAPRYVDAGVQANIQVEFCGNCAPLETQLFPVESQVYYSYLPPQHDISIGCMQDFCRDEYQLGGMLSTYV
jgi:hypothetical protein